MSEVVECTGFVSPLHVEGAAKLEDLGIVGMESVDESVEVGHRVLVLLHLAESEGALLVGFRVVGVATDGLCRLGNDSEWGHIDSFC